jgi:multisubunit Na+/H+ antiporter MnhG subunit
MIERKRIGTILLILGIVILFLSLLADFLGLGESGFGYKQTTGTILGAIICVVGIILMFKK